MKPTLKTGDTALLIIDMLTDFDFEDGEKLFRNALPAARQIAELKRKCVVKRIPTIYVNDNYGAWREDLDKHLHHIDSSEMGRQMLDVIRPSPDDYFILKPQRSAFYQTPIEALLSNLGVTKLIFTGVTTDICIMFSAHDAYMRGFEIVVPPDCTAATDKRHHTAAIKFLRRVCDAKTK